jgi:hypothetical protein
MHMIAWRVIGNNLNLDSGPQIRKTETLCPLSHPYELDEQ